MLGKKRRTKGGLKNTKYIVLPQNESLKCNSKDDKDLTHPLSGIDVELSISIDLSKLISGIDGYVWATKDTHQAEIIGNALRVQNIEFEIVKAQMESIEIYLIKIVKKEDVKNVLDFIQNDKSGLRLMPDWSYPNGERNESFEKWINK